MIPSRTLLQRFARGRAGGVAVVFGLALVPMALFVGAALDYSRASDAKTGLSAAADAAALSAVTPNAMTLTADQAKKLASDIFTAQAATVKFATNVDGQVKVVDDANGRTALVTFTADVATSLMRLAGMTNVPIGGDAKAASAPPIYIDFYLLLDNSPSMGVAATTADITKMENATTAALGAANKCAFACHILGSTSDNYKLAKDNNVAMRIDVVRSATQQLMDTATATATVSGQYRAAVYTYASLCGIPGISTISGLTSNLSGVKSSAAAIDLMSIPYQNFNFDQCTDHDGAFRTLNLAIPTPGSGSSATSPQKVAFFVSDGVADAAYPSTCSKPTTSGRCQEPIKPAICQALKDRGIKVAVLYTTYLPLPNDGWYNDWIAPFASSIGTRMETCASPGLYFEVSPSQGISDAMNALFKKSVAQARISQ